MLTALGALPLRREIRDLEANFPDQFNLFVLAMRQLQKKSKDDPLSYYQIAGETGLGSGGRERDQTNGESRYPWDAVQGMEQRPRDRGLGSVWRLLHALVDFVCAMASSVPCPSRGNGSSKDTAWATLLTGAAQQSLHQAATDIARQFPAGICDRCVETAKTLRLPYFDYAGQVREPAPSLPDSIANPNIQVVDADGVAKSIANPLFTFNISAADPDRGDVTGRVGTPQPKLVKTS
jgi:tyrosinase